MRISGGGKLQFNGFDHTHRIGVTLDGLLLLDKPSLYKAQAIHTDLTFGPGPVNPVFTGDDSTVTGKEVPGALPACAASFVPFPARTVRVALRSVSNRSLVFRLAVPHMSQPAQPVLPVVVAWA